ncbi:hypothetical protein OG943_05550 [Amycolatopsis sp. NBC_00345]
MDSSAGGEPFRAPGALGTERVLGFDRERRSGLSSAEEAEVLAGL